MYAIFGFAISTDENVPVFAQTNVILQKGEKLDFKSGIFNVGHLDKETFKKEVWDVIEKVWDASIQLPEQSKPLS